MRFRATHTHEWYEVVRTASFRRQRREIEKRCRDILTDPYRAHNAHPYRDEYDGYWGAHLDAVTRIMYTVDEEAGIITFCTIQKFD